MTQPSRIIEETNITRIAEAIASKVEIHWDVVTNNAQIQFWVNQAITENGEFKGLEHDTRSEFRPLSVNFADIAGRTFVVPVARDAEGNVTATANVPAMLLMGAIKQAFHELYTEKLISMDPVPEVTPTASPNESPVPTATGLIPTPQPSATPTPSGE